MAIKLGDALLYLDADDKDLKKGLESAERQSKGWGATMTGLFQGFGMGIFSAVGGAIQGAFSQIGEAISMGSDLAETQSKINTLLGDQAAWVTEWADNAVFALGMTKQAALDGAAGIANMFQQMGIGGEVAADAGVGMVELASDIASFHNVAEGATGVMDSLSAAFRGEFDSVQRYAPLLNAAAVEQRALTNAHKESAAELTASEKALATYQLLMEGAGAAVGDFARTNEGWAGTVKILTTAWDEFKTLLGQTLIPLLTPLLAKLRELAEWALPLIAEKITTEVIPAIEEWADNFDTWWAEHGQPFLDEIQQMWSDIIEAATLAMDDTETEFGLNLESMEALAEVLGEKIGEALGGAIGEGLQEWWDTNYQRMWDDFFVAPTVAPGSFADWITRLFGGGGMSAPSMAPSVSPSSGGVNGSSSMPQAVSIAVNVDAANRGVADAARDGTLDALRAAGMR